MQVDYTAFDLSTCRPHALIHTIWLYYDNINHMYRLLLDTFRLVYLSNCLIDKMSTCLLVDLSTSVHTCQLRDVFSTCLTFKNSSANFNIFRVSVWEILKSFHFSYIALTINCMALCCAPIAYMVVLPTVALRLTCVFSGIVY